MSFSNIEFRPGGRLALRVNDAVAASGLSRSSLYKLMSEGKLTAVKVAGRRLILVEELHRLLKAGVQQ
jgi:excisionase family DNA binding protein